MIGTIVIKEYYKAKTSMEQNEGQIFIYMGL